MITGPLHSIPSPHPPNPERLGIFLRYIADVLMELEQEEQAAQAQAEAACTGEDQAMKV